MEGLRIYEAIRQWVETVERIEITLVAGLCRILGQFRSQDNQAVADAPVVGCSVVERIHLSQKGD
jgi:hypothetical protein